MTSNLSAGKFSIPFGFELYRRNEDQADFKSKNELAKTLIARAVAEGFCFDRVIMDVWYFNFENTSYIEGLGKDWVAGCKNQQANPNRRRLYFPRKLPEHRASNRFQNGFCEDDKGREALLDVREKRDFEEASSKIKSSL